MKDLVCAVEDVLFSGHSWRVIERKLDRVLRKLAPTLRQSIKDDADAAADHVQDLVFALKLEGKHFQSRRVQRLYDLLVGKGD